MKTYFSFEFLINRDLKEISYVEEEIDVFSFCREISYAGIDLIAILDNCCVPLIDLVYTKFGFKVEAYDKESINFDYSDLILLIKIDGVENKNQLDCRNLESLKFRFFRLEISPLKANLPLHY